MVLSGTDWKRMKCRCSKFLGVEKSSGTTVYALLLRTFIRSKSLVREVSPARERSISVLLRIVTILPKISDMI